MFYLVALALASHPFLLFILYIKVFIVYILLTSRIFCLLFVCCEASKPIDEEWLLFIYQSNTGLSSPIMFTQFGLLLWVTKLSPSIVCHSSSSQLGVKLKMGYHILYCLLDDFLYGTTFCVLRD